MSNDGDSGQLVSVTANAAEKVRELLSREADPTHGALRLAVRHGCCSGYQYALGFDLRHGTTTMRSQARG